MPVTLPLVAHGSVAMRLSLAGVFQTLSDLEFGPYLHGVFDNGRVEGWVVAKPLEPPQMGQVRRHRPRCRTLGSATTKPARATQVGCTALCRH